jgi:hypothetical protein
MSRNDARRQMADLARDLGRPRRSNPVSTLYRWRYEVAAAAIVPTSLVMLDRAVGLAWSLLVLFCLASTVLNWPAARRFVRVRLRGVLVQHRLRTAFARARICTLDGRGPTILWVSPRQRQVLVLLACPAGLDTDLVQESREMLAAACFATEVRVTRHPRFAHLLVLSVRTANPDRGTGE